MKTLMGKNGYEVGSVDYFKNLNEKSIIGDLMREFCGSTYSTQYSKAVDSLCDRAQTAIYDIHYDLSQHASSLRFFPKSERDSLAMVVKGLKELLKLGSRSFYSTADACVSLLSLEASDTRPKSRESMQNIEEAAKLVRAGGKTRMTYSTGYDLIKRAASDGVDWAAGSDLNKQTFFAVVVGDRSKEFVQDLWGFLQYQKEKDRLTGRCGKVLCTRDYMDKIETQVFGHAQSWVRDCDSYYGEIYEGLRDIADVLKKDLIVPSIPINPDNRERLISVIQYLDKLLGTRIESVLTVHHMPQYVEKKGDKEFQESIEKLKIWASHSRVGDYREWSNYDALDYFMQKMSPTDNDVLYIRKSAYVNAVADVIEKASAFYGVPSLIVAGVAFNEFGGDPPLADDAKYAISKLTPDFLDGFGIDIGGQKLRIDKNTSKISYGNISMQLRRAAETLGYYDDLTAEQEQEMIQLLQNDSTAIYLVAGHLKDLMQIDFPGVNPSDLTVDEMKVIVGRYNVGPNVSKEIAGNCGYALVFENRIGKLRRLIR